MQKDLKNINENLVNRKLVYHREGARGGVNGLPAELPQEVNDIEQAEEGRITFQAGTQTQPQSPEQIEIVCRNTQAQIHDHQEFTGMENR